MSFELWSDLGQEQRGEIDSRPGAAVIQVEGVVIVRRIMRHPCSEGGKVFGH